MNLKKKRNFLLLFLLAAALPLQSQQTIASNTATAVALPDAPQAMPDSTPPVEFARGQQPGTQVQYRQAHRLAKYIDPDEHAVALSAKDKLELSGWEQLQPYSFGTQILAAGWEHLLNSNPKYGTDKAGFGERLGAASIRQGSQAVFSDGILPIIFHQDPRYYRKGSGKFMNRVFYSASRVILIRADDGDQEVNYSQLIGYAGASALTMTYYPAVSATWHDTATGYGVSLLGAALGNEVHEFAPDLLRLIHHRHHS